MVLIRHYFIAVKHMFFYDTIFIISGILGSLGSICIILVHLCYPSLRSPTRNVLVFLSISDLAQSLFFCLYTPKALEDKTYCLVHTLWGIIAASSSFFWTACTAYVVLRTVGFPDTPIQKTEWLAFHLISWGYPLAVALHFMMDQEVHTFKYPYDDGHQGWFMCMSTSFRAEILEYQAPLIGCWLFTSVMYTMARHSLDKMPFFAEFQHQGHGIQLRTKLISVPLIFIFLRIWSLVDMILLWHQQQSFTLLTLRAICDPLQGFCNAVVFLMMTHRVRQTIQRTLLDRQWPGIRSESSELSVTAPLYNPRGPLYTVYDSRDLSSSSK